MITYVFVLLAGYFVGRLRYNAVMWKCCRSQQSRGNYWHAQYLQQIYAQEQARSDEE
jgi:hypothetical protein